MLTQEAIAAAAKRLWVDVASVKAVAAVESRGSGFRPDTGEPVILFERHKFSGHTGGRFDASHPDISNPEPGGYGSSSQQHARLQRAAKLDRDAALMSASWGRFQILGENYRLAGHESLQSFINAMYRSEDDHLAAFVDFILSDKRLLAALRARNWVRFARIYNGPGYRKNQYDTKLAAAYAAAGGAA